MFFTILGSPITDKSLNIIPISPTVRPAAGFKRLVFLRRKSTIAISKTVDDPLGLGLFRGKVKRRFAFPREEL